MDEEFLPGSLILFGSGETSAAGGKIYEFLMRQLPPSPRVAILETPAGFELNSKQVAARLAEYLAARLVNYKPQLQLIPARTDTGVFSTNNPQIVSPLCTAQVLMMGAGSPTYAVRKLRQSLAWNIFQARHRSGCAVVLASAAVIAVSRYALPVYEIYKVGEDLFWQDGLDILGKYGMNLVFIPHWNNTDGGSELDTSHCFMGKDRFDQLCTQLPPQVTLVGIDELTALWLDFAAERCLVMGQGAVHLVSCSREAIFPTGESFPLQRLGSLQLPDRNTYPDDVWRLIAMEQARHNAEQETVLIPPENIIELVNRRQAAKQVRNFTEADQLREEIHRLGWQVQDTPDGTVVTPK